MSTRGRLPRFARVEQRFPDDSLRDCSAAVTRELERLGAGRLFENGAAVAIAVGSRGIDRYPEIVRAAAEWVRHHGGRPFIVPAMGSHAGGSAESQRELLLAQGIGAPGFPAPIESSTETTCLGPTGLGFPLFLDRVALGAKAVIVVNRIKPHTDFDAPIESGITKMLTVGLGKPRGAKEMHHAFRRFGFLPALEAAFRLALEKLPPLVGLAVLENELHRCRRIEAIPGAEILAREPGLLDEAKHRMARLPMESLDLLIVDEIGKDISGSGMDTNVISRKLHARESAPGERPQVARIYVRGLTAASFGNAVGIGLADFCHRRVVTQIDLPATYLNCLTSGTPAGAAIPIHLDSDRAVLEAVLDSAPVGDPVGLKIAWIRNTLQLSRFLVSEALLDDPGVHRAVRVSGKPHELRMSEEGELESPFDSEHA